MCIDYMLLKSQSTLNLLRDTSHTGGRLISHFWISAKGRVEQLEDSDTLLKASCNLLTNLCYTSVSFKDTMEPRL
jgi:hypothetical protein